MMKLKSCAMLKQTS